MSVVGALVSIHCGGGLVVALVLVVINAEGVKKEKKKKLTCWARWRQYTEAGEWLPPMLGGEWGRH